MEVVVDREKDGDIDSWKEVQLIYNSALKQISTKLEILNDEFQHVHRYNPIEHIKWRIKTPESIVKKLKKHGYESTIDNRKHSGEFKGCGGYPCDLFLCVGYLSDRGDDQQPE